MSIAQSPRLKIGWKAASPFVLLGVAAVIAGGMVSAFTASTPSRQLAWLVAYLVLVVGVAQIGLGAGQSWLAVHPLGGGVLVTEFLGFTLGNAGVAAGTMLSLPIMVNVGGILLVASLALFLWGVRGSVRGGWLRYVYRALVALLLVSIPIGLILAQIRAGQ
ncbi:MAG: hypothetical protein ABI053_08585 [Lacisediminihabitans sp.]